MELFAVSVVEAKDQKLLTEISDISLVLASSSEKALN